MSFKRGDVILVCFPNSDLKTYKKRPALVVQADNLNTGLHQKIVAMITSNLSRSGSTRVLVEKNSVRGKQMGILSDSMVVADNLVTVLEKEIDKVIGTCSRIADVDQALRMVLFL
ncbi:MAG: type II toxin-antitoxin system PemK/MazF family toxin [Deltaproteobacteria bacterium]|nr:type II toxin-antitoxin system PemK/MazF family toxin [Deltaproteobacteria bacterium]MBI5809606.1 type II toxin-antitoxin system PemK/MazF family toxin [Deltaproteobacteria bacterium]